MKRTDAWSRIVQAIYHYLLFFVLVAFVTSCCMLLFVSTLTRSMGLTLTAENLNSAAKLTFGNVILLSLLFTGLDGLRRKLTVKKPVQQIVAGAEKMMRGDFSVRLSYPLRLGGDDTFHAIIDCLNRMAQELSSVETLRTDFISNVSHEMKTPLAVIQNYATLLQTPGLPEEKRREYARGISDHSHRLAAMVTNILKLSRLENQQIFPQSQKYDLSEQLCQALLQFENVWEQANIEIETDITDSIHICADPELMALVWSNLLSNAFKFTPGGGTVSVALTATEEYAMVTVRDTGCGMTAETGKHIFEKFYQGDASHAAQGNGLGLALVKRVVDILHAEISVESALGEGSAFTVRIRRAA